MKYKFIKEHRNEFDIARMCRLLGVNRSSYYAWFNRAESKRSKENKQLTKKINEIYFKNKGRYGSPKIRYILNSQGAKYGHNRIARLMRQTGLKSITIKKYRHRSIPVSEQKAVGNLLNRDFKCLQPNRVWVSDITYIQTKNDWVYLCCFIDLYSRKVVGWSVANNLKAELVMEALRKAYIKRKPDKGLIIHSDRGVQYSSEVFKSLLKRHNFVQSMSRKGNCWDNACMESFFSLIKKEEINHVEFENLEHVKYVVFKYIDVFYNRQRIHSYLEYKTPTEFESKKIA